MWHSPSPPQLPVQLGPGQQSARGPGCSSEGLQWVWPLRKEGLVITGNLCSPCYQLPMGQSTKCRGQTLNFCHETPPPKADSPFLYPPTTLNPLSHSPNPHQSSHCDICEARSPHNKNTLGKCLGSNVCLNWPDESHLDWVCAILLSN